MSLNNTNPTQPNPFYTKGPFSRLHPSLECLLLSVMMYVKWRKLNFWVLSVLYFCHKSIQAASGQVNRVFDSQSKGLGFDSLFWSYVEVPTDFAFHTASVHNPSQNGYLMHKSRAGSIVAGYICAHLAQSKDMHSHGYLYLQQVHLPSLYYPPLY